MSGWLVPRRLALTTSALGLVVLVAAQLLQPEGRVATSNASLHVALDVLEGTIALLIAYLMVARVRDRSLFSDILSLYALVVLGLSKLLLLGIPTVAAGTRGELQILAAPIGRVVGAIALALAGMITAPNIRDSPRWGRIAAVSGAATVTVIAIVSSIARNDRSQDPSDPAVLILHGVTAVALVIAAVGFVEKASRSGDELFAWFGAGCALGAVARVGYVLYPAMGFDDVYVQDFLRLGFYAVLLVGAQRELTLYWTSRTEAAALEERRRVARDLHDGLAQELVFIAGHVRRLQRDDPREGLSQLASAADRAVSEARRAIAALTHPGVQSLSEALEELANEISARYPVRVDLSLDRAADLPPRTREEILRIVREAMTNAVRHGAAQVISVALSNADGVAIEVSDDGSGFDPQEGRARAGGFGLISMRERARAAGGELEIHSAIGEGTTVKVRLPSQRES